MNIFIMGDSTCKQNNFLTYPQFGWGQLLHLFVKEDVLVFDYAENGRSTKSFIDEGRFERILNEMKPGDFVICQFGHNDEKIQDPTRYTAPFASYQDNLDYFAKNVEAKGGHIVFATSITRHKFVDGVCINTHGDYPKAMLEYAKKTNHTCVDMNQATIDLYNEIGEEESSKFHMIFGAGKYSLYPEGKDDHSHLVFNGALTIAKLFVDLISKTDDPINNVLLDLSKAPNVDWKMLID